MAELVESGCPSASPRPRRPAATRSQNVVRRTRPPETVEKMRPSSPAGYAAWCAADRVPHRRWHRDRTHRGTRLRGPKHRLRTAEHDELTVDTKLACRAEVSRIEGTQRRCGLRTVRSYPPGRPRRSYSLRTARLGAKQSCGTWAAVLASSPSASPDIAPGWRRGLCPRLPAGWPRTLSVSPLGPSMPGRPRAQSGVLPDRPVGPRSPHGRHTRHATWGRVVRPTRRPGGRFPITHAHSGSDELPGMEFLARPPCRTSLVTVGDSNGGRRRLSRRDICDHAHC